MMNTDVVNTGRNYIAPDDADKIVVTPKEFSEIIWEKKPEPPKPRFTAADLWSIRKNARSFSIYNKR